MAKPSVCGILAGELTREWAVGWAYNCDYASSSSTVHFNCGQNHPPLNLHFFIHPAEMPEYRCATVSLVDPITGPVIGSALVDKRIQFSHSVSSGTDREAEVLLFCLLSSVHWVDERSFNHTRRRLSAHWQKVFGHRVLLSLAYLANDVPLDKAREMAKQRLLPSRNE